MANKKELKVFTHDEAYDSNKWTPEFIARHHHVKYPEGFKEKLIGKTIDEQMKLFGIVNCICDSYSSYEDTNSEKKYKTIYPIDEHEDVCGIIVTDGLIEGVVIQGYTNQVPAGPYDSVLTYYASDNNGAGYKEREDYASLICIHGNK